MKQDKIIKTVRQYSKPLPEETMEFLRGIAEDYAKIKAYVFSRYSGINSLEKLYPGYDVQNEMVALGIRNELNLPYNYFGHAIFDAIGNIKSLWSNLKIKIISLTKQNENLNDDERYYIFTILKRDAMLSAVLKRQEFELLKAFENKKLDYKRINNLICRYVRKYHIKPSINEKADYFHVDKTAYRYKNGGILLTSRISNKRVFIPLTDNAVYVKQLTVILRENRIEIIAPIEVTPKNHPDYGNRVALSLGYISMLTSSSGAEYGVKLGELLSERTERIYHKRRERGKHYSIYHKYTESGETNAAKKIKVNNLGLKKTLANNNRELERIKSYINSELNRMFEEEKPLEIIIPARSKQFGEHMAKTTKQKLSRWMVGYVRKRLCDKCAANSVKLTEVNGAYTGIICSECGGEGKRSNQIFICGECNAKTSYSFNAAKNLLKKADKEFFIPNKYG